jgi:hypothetical protein
MSVIAVESQISIFLRKYTPAVEAQLREARTRLRAMFPRGFELVYDNYNALVFGISPTERTSDAFISVAGYPRWVTLFFLHGADLRDPHGPTSKVKASKSGTVSTQRIPKTSTHPRSKRFIAQACSSRIVRRFCAARACTTIRQVGCQPSSRPRRPRK